MGKLRLNQRNLLAQGHTAHCNRKTKHLLPPKIVRVPVVALTLGLWAYREMAGIVPAPKESSNLSQ